jgi:hypothetical protein
LFRFHSTVTPSQKRSVFAFIAKNEANFVQENGEVFIRTVQIWQFPSPVHTNYFKAVLDAGCYAGDLITSEVVAIVGCQNKVEACNEVIGMCLHGHPLRSTGTVVLQWEGVGFYKVFETRFHIIEGDCLPWQVILGANTCAKHGLLAVGVGAFGGSNIPVFPKKGKSKLTAHLRLARLN